MINKKIVIMQCNTNYTAEKNNFNYINLNVLKSYKKLFPKVILGLSDHTLGYETVLGSIFNWFNQFNSNTVILCWTSPPKKSVRIYLPADT